MEKVICVFDRMDENSMLAAAVLKNFGHFKIMHVDQVDKVLINPEIELYWLGITPVSSLLLKTPQNKHIVYMPGSEIIKVGRGTDMLSRLGRNMTIIGGNYVTITEQVIDLLLKPEYTGHHDPLLEAPEEIFQCPKGMENIVPWIGAAYAVNMFDEKKTDPKTIARAWMVIRNAFDYVHYDRPLELAEDPTDPEELKEVEEQRLEVYLNDIANAKKLLGNPSRRRFVPHEGRLLVTHTITATDHHMYVMKRLLDMAGQSWRSPLVVLDELYYSSNQSKKLFAAAA